jgi:hypothetical protein
MFNAEINRKLDLITRLLVRLLHLVENEGEYLMALQPEVQALVDQVTANTNSAQAAQAALKAEADQITALQAQIAGISPGAPIDAEDLQAIKDATAQLQQTNAAMQTAVPANTPPT